MTKKPLKQIIFSAPPGVSEEENNIMIEVFVKLAIFVTFLAICGWLGSAMGG